MTIHYNHTLYYITLELTQDLGLGNTATPTQPGQLTTRYNNKFSCNKFNVVFDFLLN